MLNQRGKPRMQIVMRNVNSLRSLPKFALHPLIHTLLKFNLAQDAEKKKSGAIDSAVIFARKTSLRYKQHQMRKFGDDSD